MISFLSVFPPFRGGIARFSDYLYKNLGSVKEIDGVNFKTLYPKLLFPGTTQYEKPRVPSYAEEVMHSYNPLIWKKTAQRIANDKPKVLLISYWHPFFIPAFNSVIKRVKKISPSTKVVTIAHNVLPHESFPFSEKLMRSFFQNNDLVITLSSQTEQEFSSLDVSTKTEKLFHPIYETTLPPEPKESLREKYGFKSDDRIILFFGLIREYKGLDVLIKTLNNMDVVNNKFKPLIVGEFYDDKQKYIDIINPQHKDAYTIIDRFVSNKESAEVMSISDLLILPYKTASQSGVLADALNFNLPSIVSNHPGVTEYLKDGENGLIFESENIEMLQSKLTQYFENEGLQQKIRKNVTDLKDELSWKTFTLELDKYLKIL